MGILEYLLEDAAKEAIENMDYLLDLAISRQGIPWWKEYTINNRDLLFRKACSDDNLAISISILGVKFSSKNILDYL